MVIIGLELENPLQSGDVIHIELARSRRWLDERRPTIGNVKIDIPEIGISGSAKLTHIQAIKENPGNGCLVLMTMQHVASRILKLRFDTGTELEVTPYHRFYVENDVGEAGWVEAESLKPGQLLRSDVGPVRLKAVASAQPNRRVFNLEVSQEHTYRVSKDRLWAHNTCIPPVIDRFVRSTSKEIARGGKIDKVGELVEKFGGSARNWRKMKGWDSLRREIHWYEHPGIGVKGLKWAGELDPF
jgi:hypothetical protein